MKVNILQLPKIKMLLLFPTTVKNGSLSIMRKISLKFLILTDAPLPALILRQIQNFYLLKLPHLCRNRSFHLKIYKNIIKRCLSSKKAFFLRKNQNFLQHLCFLPNTFNHFFLRSSQLFLITFKTLSV